MNLHQDSIDVVVLGEGLGGLIAASLLVQSHLRVLLLKEKEYQPVYVREGYRFVPFSNFQERGIQPHLIQKISRVLSQPKFPDLPTHGGSFQIILPEARIDLFPHGPLFDREIRREFPKEEKEIKRVYALMMKTKERLDKEKNERKEEFFPLAPSSSLWRRLKVFQWKRELLNSKLSSFSKEFKEYLKLQILAKGNLLSDQIDLSLASYLLISDVGFKGIPLEKLREILFEKFMESGGKVLDLEGVEALERRGQDRYYLLFKKGGEALHSKFLLLNTPLHRISERFGFLQRRLSKWIKRIRPSFRILPLFLGIRERGIPVGMQELLISIFDLNRSYEDGNFLFLSLSPKGEESQAPEGRRALLAEGLIALNKWDSISLDRFQKGVLSHLKYLIPFFEDFVEFIDFQWAFEQADKISYPHLIYETDSNFRWREGLIPLRVSKDLFFIGKENFPYLGVEGEILGGIWIGREILRKAQKDIS